MILFPNQFIDYILKHGLYFQATLINFEFITMQ